ALSGPGKIIGVGNGDPSCHEPDQFIAPAPYHIKPVTDWHWKSLPEVYGTNLAETAEFFDETGWQRARINSDSGPLNGEAKAVFVDTFFLRRRISSRHRLD